MIDDAQLIDAAAAAARQQAIGNPPDPKIVSLLAAIAATREEAHRHELARRSADIAGELTPLALQLLRVGIFALGAA